MRVDVPLKWRDWRVEARDLSPVEAPGRGEGKYFQGWEQFAAGGRA